MEVWLASPSGKMKLAYLEESSHDEPVSLEKGWRRNGITKHCSISRVVYISHLLCLPASSKLQGQSVCYKHEIDSGVAKHSNHPFNTLDWVVCYLKFITTHFIFYFQITSERNKLWVRCIVRRQESKHVNTSVERIVLFIDQLGELVSYEKERTSYVK